MSNQREGNVLWTIIGGLIVIALIVVGIVVANKIPGTLQPRDVTALEKASGGIIDVLDVDVSDKAITIYIRLLGSLSAETVRAMAPVFDELIAARYDGKQEGILIVFVSIHPDGSAIVAQATACDAKEMVLRGAERALCNIVLQLGGVRVDKSHLRWAN